MAPEATLQALFLNPSGVFGCRVPASRTSRATACSGKGRRRGAAGAGTTTDLPPTPPPGAPGGGAVEVDEPLEGAIGTIESPAHVDVEADVPPVVEAPPVPTVERPEAPAGRHLPPRHSGRVGVWCGDVGDGHMDAAVGRRQPLAGQPITLR